MPQAETTVRLPLALAVLRGELAAIDAQFDAAATVEDSGERAARSADLLRAIDRYLRLGREVLHPVLRRLGVANDSAEVSNERLSRELRALSQQSKPDALARLRSQFQRHRQVQEQETFPSAAKVLQEEPGLAAELEEVRNRMKGAFGV